MSKPALAPGARTLSQLQPPPTLSAAQLALWRESFSMFPPGYFTPSDLNGMLLYLETVADYRGTVAAIVRARTPATKLAARKEMREARKQLIVLQRALKMYPTTRLQSEAHRNLANNPGKQAGIAGDVPMWKRVMQESGALPPTKVKAPKRVQ